jgi:hypothetical protein
MKDAKQIKLRISEIDAQLELRRSYGGPDPDPIGTARLEVVREVLIWTLSK